MTVTTGLDWWRARLEEAPAGLDLPRACADPDGPVTVPLPDADDALVVAAGLLARYHFAGSAVLTVGQDDRWVPVLIDLSDDPTRAVAAQRCHAAVAEARDNAADFAELAAAVGPAVTRVAVHLDGTPWPLDTDPALQFRCADGAITVGAGSSAEAVTTARHLAALVTNWKDERHLSEVEILAPDERAELLRTASGPDEPLSDSTVWQLIAQRATAMPDAAAVRDDHTELTYAELIARAEAVARQLAESGIGRGDRVGLCVQRSVAMVVGLLGVMRSGAAYVPVDPTYPADRVAMMVEDAQLSTVVTEQALADTLPAEFAARVLVDGAATDHRADLPALPSGSDTAYVIFTSGSTGRPKGVVIGHRALLNFVQTIAGSPGLTDADRLLAVTTLSFDIAGLELLVPLIVGGCVVVAEQHTVVDPTALADRLIRHDITVMQATPATWRMLIDSGWPGRPGLKVLCGGEALPAGLAAELESRCAELWNMYGPTETTIWSLAIRLHTDDPITIGRPIGNTRTYVAGRNQELLADGLPGELLIGGDGLADGYLGRPDLTADRFISRRLGAADERLYRTGDLVRRTANGSLEFLGRMDNQVKVRGFRIELGEIETVLDARPEVGRSVAVVRPDPRSGANQIVAYVVAAPGAAADPAQLRQAAQEQLPGYMVPSAIVVLDEFVLTLNGKIDRKALPEPVLEASTEIEPPATDLEASLLDIWRTVLGIDHIGVTDDVFALGTGSLTLARLYTQIAKDLDIEFPVAAAFEAPTVRTAAAYIERLRRGARDTGGYRSLVPIRATGTRAPLFLVHGGAGTVLLYEPLATALGDDQPVYAFQAAGLYGRTAPQRSVRAMAELYVSELRAIQPSGPYRIGGYCYGALVAFEMARLLAERGAKTELLVAFNGPSPSYIRRYRPRFDADGAINDAAGQSQRGPRGPKAKLQHIWTTRTSAAGALRDTAAYGRTVVRDKTKAAVYLGQLHGSAIVGRPLSEPMRESGSFQWLSMYAQDHYDPPRYSGDMVVVRAEGLYHADDLGWGDHVDGIVDVVEVPGAQLTPRDSMKTAHVGPIVAAMRTRLDRLAGATGQ